MMNFLFNPNGRVSRGGIWLGLFLPQLAVSFVAAFADAMMVASAGMQDAAPAGGPLSLVVALFFFWPGIAVSVKRFHDRGMSGWWVLWFLLIVVAGVVFAFMGGVAAASTGKVGAGAIIGVLVAIAAGLAQFVILYLLPGQSGGNEYGPDPRSGSRVSHNSDEGSRSEWADRLADPARMKTAAAKAAEPQPTRAARTASWPASAGPRTSFGRRGA